MRGSLVMAFYDYKNNKVITRKWLTICCLSDKYLIIKIQHVMKVGRDSLLIPACRLKRRRDANEKSGKKME